VIVHFEHINMYPSVSTSILQCVHFLTTGDKYFETGGVSYWE
jgi:hypothetical protein